MIREKIEKAYSVVWVQCTNAIQSVIKGTEEYREN